MHMPGAAAVGAIVPPASGPELARLAWQRLQPERWPLPRQALPEGTALVGGAVRDALLDRLSPEPDLDFVVSGDAVALCRQLSRRHGGSAVVLDAERSIARLVIHHWSIDLARQEGGSLVADLRRRDYTINAMALPLDPGDGLVDPLGGAAHLSDARLVAVSETNLLDDPLRLLRGLRLACELNFQLEPQTRQWIGQHHGALAGVAGERVLAELEKLAAAGTGEQGLADCLRLGLLQPWQPGQSATGTPTPEAWRALLSRLTPSQGEALGLEADELSQALPLARLAASLEAQSLRALRSSRRLQQRVERLRHWQHQLIGPDGVLLAGQLPEADRLRLQLELEADLPALLLGWQPEAASSWLQRWRDPHDPLFHPRPLIDGASLQRELALKASPQLGQLLQHLLQERAFGRIQSRSEALIQAQLWLKSAQLRSEMGPRRD